MNQATETTTAGHRHRCSRCADAGGRTHRRGPGTFASASCSQAAIEAVDVHRQEAQVDARIETAFALTDAQLSELTATLSQQFNRKVNAEVVVDSALIGGVKVTIGDLVVDASVRGKLAALAASLKS